MEFIEGKQEIKARRTLPKQAIKNPCLKKKKYIQRTVIKFLIIPIK